MLRRQIRVDQLDAGSEQRKVRSRLQRHGQHTLGVELQSDPAAPRGDGDIGQLVRRFMDSGVAPYTVPSGLRSSVSSIKLTLRCCQPGRPAIARQRCPPSNSSMVGAGDWLCDWLGGWLGHRVTGWLAGWLPAPLPAAPLPAPPERQPSQPASQQTPGWLAGWLAGRR